MFAFKILQIIENGMLAIVLFKGPSVSLPLSHLSLSVVNVASCHVVLFPCTSTIPSLISFFLFFMFFNQALNFVS